MSETEYRTTVTIAFSSYGHEHQAVQSVQRIGRMLNLMFGEDRAWIEDYDIVTEREAQHGDR